MNKQVSAEEKTTELGSSRTMKVKNPTNLCSNAFAVRPDLTLDISEGILALLGSNGLGENTLMKIF